VNAAQANHQGEHQPEFEGYRRQVAGDYESQAMRCKGRKESHMKAHL